MKKLILGLALSLSISAVFACHIDPIGECDGNSYFITRVFNPNSIYHFIVAGDTIETFTTGALVQDSIFSLPIASGTEILMAYNYIGSDFIEYSSATSSSSRYAGCGALAVQFSNVSTQRTEGGVKVNFTNYDESEVLRYDIMGSKDSKTWNKIQSIQPTGQHSYSIRLSALGAALLLPFLVFFKSKKIRPLFYLLALMIVVLFSCQKESITKTDDYKFIRVDAVKVDGGVVSSEIKSL